MKFDVANPRIVPSTKLEISKKYLLKELRMVNVSSPLRFCPKMVTLVSSVARVTKLFLCESFEKVMNAFEIEAWCTKGWVIKDYQEHPRRFALFVVEIGNILIEKEEKQK